MREIVPEDPKYIMMAKFLFMVAKDFVVFASIVLVLSFIYFMFCAHEQHAFPDFKEGETLLHKADCGQHFLIQKITKDTYEDLKFKRESNK